MTLRKGTLNSYVIGGLKARWEIPWLPSSRPGVGSNAPDGYIIFIKAIDKLNTVEKSILFKIVMYTQTHVSTEYE